MTLITIPSTGEPATGDARLRARKGGAMSTRLSRAITAALVLTAWAVPGVSRSVAAAEKTESCTAEADFVITPGLSTNPSSGTFTTGDTPGTLKCKSGASGTIAFNGKYGTKDPDSCSSGGEGTASDTYKFSDGSTVTDDVDITYGPFQGGALGGSYKGSRSSGTFEVTSIDGDCVSKPITRAHGVLKNIVIKR